MMRAIPSDLDLSRFVGQQLQQICIGPYDLQFCFEGSDAISCEHKVTVSMNGKETNVFDREGWHESNPLTAIVGREVVEWKIESSHCFSFTLNDEAVITFYSQDGQ